MKKNIQLVKGTHDIYGDEIKKFNFIIEKFYSVTEKFNFHQVQTPIIEHQDLFTRSVGEHTDIVSKEMYSFTDKGDSTICLRPEATSSIARLVASEYQSGSMRISTHGPMFRRERPQKGRYRQFHQINLENMGEKSPYLDFEIILIASNLLNELGIDKKHFKLILNSLGSQEDQKNYSKILIDYLTQYKSKLSETSLSRLEKNPLRILDSKDEQDKEILQNAPFISENLSQESTHYFNQLKELLKNNGIDFTIDHKLVRGLDYYTDTAFEFQTNEDKRQNAILAGGRYDKLISLISTRDIPGIGWAAGVERLMSLVQIENQKEDKFKVLFAVQNEQFLLNSKILNQIYNLDCIHEVKINKNIKKIFTYADKNNFDFILLIGEEEESKNKIILKNLNTKEQKIFNQSEIKLLNEIR
ncbi:MAG: histidine--tRNA ligase [Alphaproteobacteria bacterium]|jgi:histidyl-tRNA synthetase|nr:histidine--tRNA ligase [alpha proteobacterium HIMB59]